MRIGKIALALFLLIVTSGAHSQIKDPVSNQYNATNTIQHALIHTKLKVDFDFMKKQLNGEEWVTMKSHFYPSSKVVLDAKAMIIHQVKLNDIDLDFNYDGAKIRIDLPKSYTRVEPFTLYIKYTAKPEEVKQRGSAAITQAKGLYFINADGSDKNKPTQVWTQGETEASSCWFPTIDSPNQKTSQEIYMTVPKRFKTLSNGTLISQTNTSTTTRTDYWKFDKKHAPYLFFMGVGEFEIVKDSYKKIPIAYYVEKEYATYAKDIFGLTPEMMAFYSKVTGIEYPWSSYSQFVGRDYVSGAMENTTAVIHGETAYQMPGQLIDENIQENTIAHELFHHWFGNLVTAESWSNIAINEAFANYGEYLWREHKYGIHDADAHLLENNEVYKQGGHSAKELVRFQYLNREDLFDPVSYNKGGAVLHMLRNYVGDEAFYASLNHYLTVNKFGTAEVHQLRLSFEEITGKDLNWFFNQWFYNSGHPKIQVSYDYNTLEKKVAVNLLQVDKNFQFPIEIDIIENGKRTTHSVFVNGRDASFVFSYKQDPEVIIVNANGALLADFEDRKTIPQYISQLKHARYYGHKKEAIIGLSQHQENKKVFTAIANAMNDRFYKVRILALENINLINKYSKKAVIEKIKRIAGSDKKTKVQAAAIETLGKLTDIEYLPIFQTALQSKSFSVLGKALVAMYYVDKNTAVQRSKRLPEEVKKIIATPLTRIYIEDNDDAELAFIAKNVLSGMFVVGNARVKDLYTRAFQRIAKSNNTEAIQNLVNDLIKKGIQYKQFNFDKTALNLMQQLVAFQKNSEVSNKLKHIELIRLGMSQLIK